MKKFLRRLGGVYNKLEEYTLVWSLIFTVCLIFYQIIMRYVFNNSSYWSEELARYIFMWQIWMGSSIGLREGKHIRIGLLTGKLKGRAKTAFALLSNIILFAFCLFLVAESKVFLDRVIMLNMQTPALRIPFFLVYASLPVSSLAICVRLIGVMLREIKELFLPPADIEGGGI